mmetsp:Transcript_12910/g.17374  ORF Transcript_12910/g.17374 Transcript_12910/m.17374 type:complete len:118 (+) Transcript_12910:280-633(+)
MTKKRSEWHKKTQRAQHAGNTTGGYGSYQRRGLREAAYEVKPEWPAVFEFPKQRHDKLPDVKPVDMGVHIEAGQLHQFDMQWTRSRVTRPRKVTHLDYNHTEISIIGDEYIQEIARE